MSHHNHDSEKQRATKLLQLTGKSGQLVAEKLEPTVSFGAEEHQILNESPGAAFEAKESVTEKAKNITEKTPHVEHPGNPKATDFKSSNERTHKSALRTAVVTGSRSKDAAKQYGLALAPASDFEPVSCVVENVDNEQLRETSTPGAFRMYMSGDHENQEREDDSTHYTGNVVGSHVSAVESTLRDNSISEVNYHVPIAQTVDSQVFQAIPDDGMDKKRQQRKIAIIVAVGVLVVIAVVLGAVLGTRGNGGGASTTAPSASPTMDPVSWVPLGSEILGINAGDQSGISLTMSDNGTVLAVGAIYYDGFNLTNNETDSGLVRVYRLVDDNWVQQGSNLEGEAPGDLAGTSVALSSDGSIVAVGAYKNNGVFEEFSDLRFESGHVRIYVWSGIDWIQRGADIDGDALQEGSGFSVALSSDGLILAVGSPGYPGTAGVQAGRIRIFRWDEDSDTWIQLGEQIEGVGLGDLFGESVSLSADGTIVASGAWRNDPTPDLINAGHVRVFQWNGTGWNLFGNVINGEAADDRLGTSPSVVLTPDGRTLAVGATQHDGDLGADTGQVKIFDFSDNGEWIQRGGDIQGSAGDELGSSIEITDDGNVVLVGISSFRRNGINSGLVRAYMWNGNEWSQTGDDIDGEAAGDLAGVDIAMSSDGSIIAVGAPENDGGVSDSGVGQVRAFKKMVTA